MKKENICAPPWRSFLPGRGSARSPPMKNNDDIHSTDTNKIKQLINRVKQGELDQGDAQLIEKLLNILLTIVSLLQRKHTSIRRMKELWVPKMPSESFRPEFHQIDEFNFDSAFVNSDNSASHSLGHTNLRKIRPSFRDGPFALFRRINLIAPSRFLRLDLPSISIREHINRAGFKLPADTGDAGHRPRGLR